jgi:hypothetical protein
MERLAILAALALLLSTTALADGCMNNNCATPEPAPFQTADGCIGNNCAIEEPTEERVLPQDCSSGTCARLVERARFACKSPNCN